MDTLTKTISTDAELSGRLSRFRPALAFAGWMLACYASAAMGGLFMPGEWYASLQKPSWNPPGWIFRPVWTALYTMMAVAAWMVWRRGGWGKQRKPLLLFLVQLMLNALWTRCPSACTDPVWRLPRLCCSGWPLWQLSWSSVP